MEVLIITLLITNLVVVIGVGAVVVGEISKGNKKIQELRNIVNCSVIQQRNYNKNLHEANEEISVEIQKLEIKHDMTMQDIKKTISEEVPKTLFTYLYAPYRHKE